MLHIMDNPTRSPVTKSKPAGAGAGANRSKKIKRPMQNMPAEMNNLPKTSFFRFKRLTKTIRFTIFFQVTGNPDFSQV